jgi:hypothetical protein
MYGWPPPGANDVINSAKLATLSIVTTAALLGGPTMCAAYVPPLEEPSSEVVQSGQCKVPVCGDIDFGTHSFRYYAPDRTNRVRFIPKGACECQEIRRIAGDHVVLSVETRDGKTWPNVSVLRIYPPDHPRANSANMTTWERYTRKGSDFDEIREFEWDGDTFATFRVFRSRYSRGKINDYFFVPRSAGFNFPNQSQPIAFDIPNGHPRHGKDGEASPTFSAEVQLAPSVHFFQFFSPRLIPSNNWIAAMERSAEVIDARLFPK